MRGPRQSLPRKGRGDFRTSETMNVVKISFQQRNKPKEPPKAPKSAPFFLPTVPGVEFKFDVEKEAGTMVSQNTFYRRCHIKL